MLFLLNYDVMFARMSVLFMNESTSAVGVEEKHAIFVQKKEKNMHDWLLNEYLWLRSARLHAACCHPHVTHMQELCGVAPPPL